MTLSALPFAAPSTRQFQGLGFPPALGRLTSKVDLHIQVTLALRYKELKTKKLIF